MTTFEEVSRRKSELLRAAASHKARNVRVFGSVARGEDRPDSDIDFLVCCGGALEFAWTGTDVSGNGRVCGVRWRWDARAARLHRGRCARDAAKVFTRLPRKGIRD